MNKRIDVGSDREKDSRFSWVEIDLGALAGNMRVIEAARAGKQVKIMAVVKADAYGHGALEVSNTVLKNGAHTLGVALAEEGIALREGGIEAPIYILGECPPAAAGRAMENNLILTVNSMESARLYSSIAGKKSIKGCVSINIDTGMNRLGINWRDIKDIPVIWSLKSLDIYGIFSHLSCAGEEDPEYTQIQIDRFSHVIRSLGSMGIKAKEIHLANSAAFFRFGSTHFNTVRTGLSVYGLNPFSGDWESWLPEDARESVMKLIPVLSLKSRISFIKKVGPGEPISYCGTFRTEKDSVIATIPVGYADGYCRLLSNRSKVLVNGHEAPVIGNITMDQSMLDLTGVPGKEGIRPGDEVVLIGRSGNKKITAEDIAGIMGTINYEITCMIKGRIPRIYING